MAVINGVDEIWRPVVSFEGLYEVSSFGRVRSLDQDKGVDNRGRKRFKNGRLLKPSYAGSGRYPRVVLGYQGGHGKQTTHAIHQLVMQAFVGPCPIGMEVRHLDGDSTNARLDNLEYGTPKENQADRYIHGTATSQLPACPQGHAWTQENTKHTKRQRLCIACDRKRKREWARMKRAALKAGI